MLYQSQRAPGESIAQSIGWARIETGTDKQLEHIVLCPANWSSEIETGCCGNPQAATSVSLDRLDTHSNSLIGSTGFGMDNILMPVFLECQQNQAAT